MWSEPGGAGEGRRSPSSPNARGVVRGDSTHAGKDHPARPAALRLPVKNSSEDITVSSAQ